ncbi:O-antigen ligase family protein [Rhodospirillaceae bacterium SYSU D60014]|uniref:O-antigen ligase family protein n=1 Tax=Virgifigura deserti TaxID=2268457 RepID=UPI000E6708F3
MSWRTTSGRAWPIQRRPGLALALAALALAPVAVFASAGTVLVVAITGAVLAFGLPELRAALRALSSPLSLALIAFLVWAALSAVWAPDPGGSFVLTLRCGLLFAAGLICVSSAAGLQPTERRRAAIGIALGGALMLLLLVVETASNAALTRFIRDMNMAELMERTDGVPLARGGTLFAVLCWPALLAAARLSGGRAAALLFLPIPALLYLQPITASVVAIGAGAAAFALVYAWPRPMLRLLFGLLLVSLAATPLLPPVLAATAPLEQGIEYLPLSWQHRVEIWLFAADKIAERPLLGWGFDATRSLGAIQSHVVSGSTLALHPHNFSLQLWLELGGVGVVIAGWLGVLLFQYLLRLADDRAAVATAAAALTCYLVYGQLSRGAWQNWWLAAAWLLAAALAVVMPFRRDAAAVQSR